MGEKAGPCSPRAAGARADSSKWGGANGRAWTAGSIVLLIASMTGCAGGTATSAAGTPATSSAFRIVGTDGIFEAPHRLSAGLRHIVFENHGTRQHEAMLVKLAEGMTPAAYFDAVKRGNVFPEGALDYSGAGLTAPGEAVEIWLRVDPGNYMVICWNGKHVAPAHTLTVVADGTPDDPAPREDVVLRLVDYRFEFDRAIEKGQRVIRVETPGPSMHEVDIFRMRDAATIADLERWYKEEDKALPHERPIPADAMGGLSDNHDIRRVGWLRRTFAPGRYVFTCHLSMPSSGNGAPHVSHADVGMIREIVVAP